jgi:hypothetical protein
LLRPTTCSCCSTASPSPDVEQHADAADDDVGAAAHPGRLFGRADPDVLAHLPPVPWADVFGAVSEAHQVARRSIPVARVAVTAGQEAGLAPARDGHAARREPE